MLPVNRIVFSRLVDFWINNEEKPPSAVTTFSQIPFYQEQVCLSSSGFQCTHTQLFITCVSDTMLLTKDN